MKTNTLLFTLIILLGFTACDKDSDQAIKDIDLSLKSQEIIQADNDFGLDMFQRIHDEEADNFMISPLSISMALSMAYNGADTETKVQMAEALRIDEFTTEELNATYRQLIDALTTIDPKVAMEIANSIWYRDGYPVEQEFLDVNQTNYDAEIKKADFNDAGTVDLINDWVNDKTNEKIPTIIDDISPMAVMYIINAIYFNGTWTKEFNEENTFDGIFTKADGNTIEAEMMQSVDTVNYFSNDLFSSVQLPYGDGNFNMNLLLPNHDKTVADVVNKLDGENWENWQTDYKETETVDIILPKFKIEYKNKLKTLLQQMGMEEAFTTKADFSKINPARDLFISEVIHKTFIEVDEEGTEAAAVTAIVFETTSVGGDDDKIYFHCNRPFLFAITEKETGAILFMGKLSSPEE